MNVEFKKTYLSLNLQFFAEDGKTEKATPKKREDARKEGQVVKSTELNTAVMIIAFFGIMCLVGNSYVTSLIALLKDLCKTIPLWVRQEEVAIGLRKTVTEFLKLNGILWGGLFGVAFIISYVQVGYKPTLKAITPKFSKLNPIKGIKKLFSKEALVELLKSLFKLVLLVSVLYTILKEEIHIFFKFYDFSTYQILHNVASIIVKIGFSIGGAFLVIAVADYAFQKYKFEDSIKMSKQDIKDEYKQSEGDPHIKGKRKQKMRELSMRRMMADIPKADVIITNPTHFAVAIRYDKASGKAPIVVAKGVDHLAQKIKEVAREHDVQIVENRPLARSLYATVDVGEEISQELYTAVAEVLAFVYSLKA